MSHWQADLAMHPIARARFRSEAIGFLCEVFPEKELGSSPSGSPPAAAAPTRLHMQLRAEKHRLPQRPATGRRDPAARESFAGPSAIPLELHEVSNP